MKWAFASSPRRWLLVLVFVLAILGAAAMGWLN